MFIISIILIAVLAAADQIIKLAVVDNIALGEVINLIKFGDTKIFSLTHITNTGAAWSIMQGRSWFLIGLPVLVCIAGLLYMYKIQKNSKLEMVALSMLISGGIGNLIDRIRLHEVVDYIKCDFINFPIFNFADICVVIGAILFCISIFFSEKDKSMKKEKAVSDE